MTYPLACVERGAKRCRLTKREALRVNDLINKNSVNNQVFPLLIISHDERKCVWTIHFNLEHYLPAFASIVSTGEEKLLFKDAIIRMQGETKWLKILTAHVIYLNEIGAKWNITVETVELTLRTTGPWYEHVACAVFGKPKKRMFIYRLYYNNLATIVKFSRTNRLGVAQTTTSTRRSVKIDESTASSRTRTTQTMPSKPSLRGRQSTTSKSISGSQNFWPDAVNEDEGDDDSDDTDSAAGLGVDVVSADSDFDE